MKKGDKVRRREVGEVIESDDVGVLVRFGNDPGAAWYERDRLELLPCSETPISEGSNK